MKKLTDVIILGAKPIKGMKSLGAFSNIEIAKQKTFLDLQYQNLKKKLTIKNMWYVAGHQHSKLEKYPNNVSFLYNSNYESKNNGYSLSLAIKNSTTDHVVILFNKVLFHHKIFNRLNYDRSYIFINDNSLNEYKLGCVINDSSVDNIFYNLPNKLTGIYILTGNELEFMKTLIQEHKNIDNMFVFEIINKTISLGGHFVPKVVESHKHIVCVNTSEGLQKIKRFYAKNFNT